MKIAVLSGKGGAGKTLVSVNLASVAEKSNYIDCDVEEPNGHLFFKAKDNYEENVSVKIPKVDSDLCNGCRKCLEFCKFNALAYVKDKLIIFEDICHSCGGCIMVCPENALSEKEKVIGRVEKGKSQGVNVSTGILNIGEVLGIPIINKLIYEDKSTIDEFTFIDCPPGSSCSVMESIEDADYCILVTEPTIFGVHNLRMIYDLVKLFNKPHGVIINKCMEGKNPAEDFCIKNNIKILDKIPFDKELGILNSNAKIAVRENEKHRNVFFSMLQVLKKEVGDEAVTNS